MKLLFIGTDWITKWLLTQCLFDDSDEELEITVIGQDTTEWFWTEVPRLKEYAGDERVDYQQKSLGVYVSQIPENKTLLEFDAIYITDTEPDELGVGLLDRLSAAQFKGPIILASSWQVYGWKKKKKTPILETERELQPETNAAKHLLELEKVMLKYKSLQTVILRYSEIFGPYMPSGSEIINIMIDCLSSEEIDVYPPPSRQYDWLHVKFIYNLVPKLFSRKFIGGGEIYNIGSGEERKITWFANSLRQLTNSQAPVKIHVPEDIEARGYHSLLDIEKAKKFLQYEADGQRVQYFLEVCRWVEKDLEGDKKTPELEETYPMLKPEWGTEHLRVTDEKGEPIEIDHS